MTDTVINWVNTRGKDEPEQLIFRDRKGRLIGEVDLTGVDGEPTETPQQIETVEETYLNKSGAVNEELEAQPPDKGQHQVEKFRDDPKIEFAVEIQEDPQ